MGSFSIEKDPKKIFVAGTGSGWQLMPKPTEATVYCLNDYVHTEKYGVKPDVLFIMDLLDEKPQVVSGIDDLGVIIAKINSMKIPLVGPYKYDEIPLSQAFPLDECVQKLGTPYFTNTICYMIAYAILQGAEEIHIYGVNQAGSHEYTEERGGVEYWIGQAIGRGIRVYVNGKDSQLLRFKGRYGTNILYGYLQSYDQLRTVNAKFGQQSIHQLLSPQPEFVRDIRTGRSAK